MKRPLQGTKGPLSGYLDSVDGEKITGWAKIGERPAKVIVSVAGKRILDFVPNLFREDLNGTFGFDKSIGRSNVLDLIVSGEMSIDIASDDEKETRKISIQEQLRAQIAKNRVVDELKQLQPNDLHEIFYEIHRQFVYDKSQFDKDIHNHHLISYTESIFSGYIELVQPNNIIGWCQSSGALAMLRVYEDRKEISYGVPNLQRNDIGGTVGFNISVPSSDLIAKVKAGRITVFAETPEGTIRKKLDLTSSAISGE